MIRHLSFVAGAIALSVSVPGTILAQSSDDPLVPGAVCMARTGSDGKPLAIIAPKVAEGAMAAKGFERQPCSANFSTPALREAYRDGVCHMASTWREGQLNAFEKTYGERPGVLCGMAEVAISQWQFRSQG